MVQYHPAPSHDNFNITVPYTRDTLQILYSNIQYIIYNRVKFMWLSGFMRSYTSISLIRHVWINSNKPLTLTFSVIPYHIPEMILHKVPRKDWRVYRWSRMWDARNKSYMRGKKNISLPTQKWFFVNKIQCEPEWQWLTVSVSQVKYDIMPYEKLTRYVQLWYMINARHKCLDEPTWVICAKDVYVANMIEVYARQNF